jgi:hypothetical protein
MVTNLNPVLEKRIRRLPSRNLQATSPRAEELVSPEETLGAGCKQFGRHTKFLSY